MGIRLATIPSLLVLIGLILGGCSTSRTAEPVASEISTYDTTFTASISSVERIEKGLANPLRFALKRAEGLRAVQATTDENKPYFIEFRARNALSYGHASVVFGKLKKGKIPVDKEGVLDPKRVQISGLHPATSDPKQWAKGHFVPVPAETGPSDGDFEDIYVTARFQVNLTKEEFEEVVRIVKKHKQSYPYWYAPNYATNCLGYIGSIAKDMGLKVPVIPSMPKAFVKRLKTMNS